MTSTQATPRAHLRPGLPFPSVLRVVASAVAVVAVVVALPHLMAGPRFVDRLTVANPTALPVEVSVAAAGSRSRLTLGSVPPRSEASFESVIDMGSRWNLRVVANGGAAADTTVSRSELETVDWTFTIPGPLASELSRGGGIPGSTS